MVYRADRARQSVRRHQAADQVRAVEATPDRPSQSRLRRLLDGGPADLEGDARRVQVGVSDEDTRRPGRPTVNVEVEGQSSAPWVSK